MHRYLLALISVLITCGCANDVFPHKELIGTEQNFDFARWRLLANETPPTKVQIGGRIIEAITRNKVVTIVAAQLPIVRFPAYGPKQAKSKGEFVITYPGEVYPPAFLHPGNRIMIVGTTQRTKMAELDDVARSLPAIEASCLHIWKTGDQDIADYISSAAGYATLEEETFCASDINP